MHAYAREHMEKAYGIGGICNVLGVVIIYAFFGCCSLLFRGAEITSVCLLRQQHARKRLALMQAWNAGDVSPPWRSHWSDSHAAVPVVFARAHTLLWEV